MLLVTMGGTEIQNFSIISFTVTELLQFKKLIKYWPGIYRPETKMAVTLLKLVKITPNLVHRYISITEFRKNKIWVAAIFQNGGFDNWMSTICENLEKSGPRFMAVH